MPQFGQTYVLLPSALQLCELVSPHPQHTTSTVPNTIPGATDSKRATVSNNHSILRSSSFRVLSTCNTSRLSSISDNASITYRHAASSSLFLGALPSIKDGAVATASACVAVVIL